MTLGNRINCEALFYTTSSCFQYIQGSLLKNSNWDSTMWNRGPLSLINIIKLHFALQPLIVRYVVTLL